MVKARLAFAFGASLVAIGWARAADLPAPPPLPPAAPIETEYSGWYLRGDVGVGVPVGTPDLYNVPDPIATSVPSGFLSSQSTQAFNNTTVTPSGSLGGGVGYQFNNWFRMDGTLEYRWGARLQSLYTLTDPASPYFGGPAQFADFYRADLSSFVGLVNGYVNIPTGWGVTPFIGAGVGFASNSLSGWTDQGVNSFPYYTSSSGGYFSNHTQTNFAWALMAGLDFILTPNLKLEVGYRYLNLGSISSGGSNCLAGSGGGVFSLSNCNGGVTNYIRSHNNLASNDIRIGLLWTLGDPSAPAPHPVVARY